MRKLTCEPERHFPGIVLARVRSHLQNPLFTRFAGLLRSSFKELTSPFELLRSSRFLQIRLAQMLLLQLGNGWESVLDSFMISTLGACLMNRFR